MLVAAPHPSTTKGAPWNIYIYTIYLNYVIQWIHAHEGNTCSATTPFHSRCLGTRDLSCRHQPASPITSTGPCSSLDNSEKRKSFSTFTARPSRVVPRVGMCRFTTARQRPVCFALRRSHVFAVTLLTVATCLTVTVSCSRCKSSRDCSFAPRGHPSASSLVILSHMLVGVAWLYS